MIEALQESDPQDEIKRIIASARALGMEMDEEEAIQWLTSIVATDQADGGPLQASSGSDTIDRETLTQQVDDLIRSVTSAAEGAVETDLVMSLLRLRDDITGRKSLGSGWESTLREMQADIDRLVNQFFEARLRAIPEVSAYLDSL